MIRIVRRKARGGFLLGVAAAIAALCIGGLPARAVAQPVATDPTPLLDANHPVDWLFAYKFNAASFPTTGRQTTCIFGTTPDHKKASLAFASANSGSAALVSGTGLVGTSLNDPVGATFNEIYRSDLNFVVWNDQFYGDPRLGCGKNCTGRWGHSKGILAWDNAGNGVVLQVSTPDWPGAGSSAVPRPREGNTLGCEHATDNVLVGQHFFALKLSPADTGLVLDALIHSSVVTDPKNPQIARIGGPPELAAKASKLGRIVQATDVTDVTLSSGIRLISKASDLLVPPWQLVSARLGGVPLRTATWRAGPPIPTTTDKTKVGCWRPSLGKPGAVEVATTGKWMGKTIGLSAGASHAKLGVSLDPARPFTIFGDMNQQGALSGTAKQCKSSQNGRGGMFFVLTDPQLYASMRQLLEGGTAPTAIPGKKKKASKPKPHA
jgi:hypothetical protein